MQDRLLILCPRTLKKSSKSPSPSRLQRKLVELSQHAQLRSLARQMACSPTRSSVHCRFSLFVTLTQPHQIRDQVSHSFIGVCEATLSQICWLQIVEEFVPDKIPLSPPTVDAPGKASALCALIGPRHESLATKGFDMGHCLVERRQNRRTYIHMLDLETLCSNAAFNLFNRKKAQLSCNISIKKNYFPFLSFYSYCISNENLNFYSVVITIVLHLFLCL